MKGHHPPLLVTVMLVGGMVHGQTPSESSGAPSASAVDHAAVFKEMDKNGDDRISRVEAAADGIQGDAFAKLDTNKDGWLSREEYAKRLLPK